ncbi:hypothetical protein PR048_015518 [Dryococelus australis]|uniref:Uncharacterized protein n=1 Tax=Dryococelus australis TaxID=614101 RepID=A0ABQ9HH65_9NEOP|nr:hypothetical protein PR048_015518 [Dryococelus australis]
MIVQLPIVLKTVFLVLLGSVKSWTDVFAAKSVDGKVSIFNVCLLSLFNKHAPLKYNKPKKVTLHELWHAY